LGSAFSPVAHAHAVLAAAGAVRLAGPRRAWLVVLPLCAAVVAAIRDINGFIAGGFGPYVAVAMVGGSVWQFMLQHATAAIMAMRSNTGSSSKICRLALAAAQASAPPVYEWP